MKKKDHIQAMTMNRFDRRNEKQMEREKIEGLNLREKKELNELSSLFGEQSIFG